MVVIRTEAAISKLHDVLRDEPSMTICRCFICASIDQTAESSMHLPGILVQGARASVAFASIDLLMQPHLGMPEFPQTPFNHGW